MTREARADVVRSDAISYFGVLMVGLVVLVGLWLAAFGLVTPGGGFQGGVVIAGGIALLYLVAGYGAWRNVGNEHLLDPFEGGGAGLYVALGLAALITAAPFLRNLLGPGQTGTRGQQQCGRGHRLSRGIRRRRFRTRAGRPGRRW